MISTSSPPPNQKDIVGQHTRSLRSDFNPNDKDFFDSETQRSFQPISNEGLQLLKISDADTTEVQSTLDIPNFDLILQGRLVCTIVSVTMHVFQIIWHIPLKTSTAKVLLLDEWWDGGILIGLSICVIFCTNGVGEQDSLLLSELGTIAQLLRSTGPTEFQTHSLFSVRQNSIDLVPLAPAMGGSPTTGAVVSSSFESLGYSGLPPRMMQHPIHSFDPQRVTHRR
ncbi:hypothetical protein AAEP93_003740 [Penicillium crustosum]